MKRETVLKKGKINTIEEETKKGKEKRK